MSKNPEVITILLDPRARRAQLSLRIGALSQIRAGRRRDFRVTDLAPYADKIVGLAEQGALKAYSSGLEQLSVDGLRAVLGGKPAPVSEAPPVEETEAPVEETETPAEETPQVEEVAESASEETEDSEEEAEQEPSSEESAPKKRPKRRTKAKS